MKDDLVPNGRNVTVIPREHPELDETREHKVEQKTVVLSMQELPADRDTVPRTYEQRL